MIENFIWDFKTNCALLLCLQKINNFSVLGGQYQRAIVLNNGTHLCLLDIRILSDHQQHKVDCFYEHLVDGETMTYMEINGRTREVYIATQNAIYRVPIDQKNAQAVELTKTLPNNKGNGEITGKIHEHDLFVRVL